MSEKVQRVVTIDGPAGSGKSTVSKKLAALLNFTYLDTGAMYRAVAYSCNKAGVDLSDDSLLSAFLEKHKITLRPPEDGKSDVAVYVNDHCISTLIRTQEMGMLASKVSAIPIVREHLTKLQQQMGVDGDLVAEGRDTGTVVFPHAAWKFYLDASPEVRMKRRAEQLRQKGEAVDEQQLLHEIIKRDRDDSSRAIAPLKKADDACLIDSSQLSLDQVIEDMLSQIQAHPCVKS